MKAPPLNVVDAKFVASVGGAGEFPEGPPEVAFAGRSNVGKSSLLNALTGRNALARVSKTPGRTQRINLFDLKLSDRSPLRFVDLPGYGYAAVTPQMRREWGEMIDGYLSGCRALRAVVVLVDPRRAPQQEEADLVAWLDGHRIATLVVATKIDQIPKTRRGNALGVWQRALNLTRLPTATSTLTGEGLDDLKRLVFRVASSEHPFPPAVGSVFPDRE